MPPTVAQRPSAVARPQYGVRVLTADPPTDEVINACGEKPSGFCTWVYESTNNQFLARAADWLIGRPLELLLVFAVTWLVARVMKWLVRRGVRRMLVPPQIVVNQLDALKIPYSSPDEIDTARRKARAESIGSAAAGAVVAIVWSVGVITAASVLSVQLGPLIAATGVAGVALGFGAQSLVRDCINGFFMLIEDQYGIGDTVDLGEASGTVEKVSLRTTVLRGVDGAVWHVPNGQIIRVGNRSQLWSIAIVDVAVAYTADLTVVQDLLDRTAREVCSDELWSDDVLDDPEVLGVESLGPESVTLRLRVKTHPGRQWALQRALRERIRLALSEAEIPLPARAAGWTRIDQAPEDEAGSTL